MAKTAEQQPCRAANLQHTVEHSAMVQDTTIEACGRCGLRCAIDWGELALYGSEGDAFASGHETLNPQYDPADRAGCRVAEQFRPSPVAE